MTDLGTADGPMPTHSNTIRGDAGTIPLSFTLPINPDCAANKHRACRGDAWDFTTDTAAPCACTCHKEADAA